MKIVRKLIAALMVLGAVAALTVGVLLEAGTEGSAEGMSIGFAGIAAFAVLILAGAGLVAVALQP